MLNATDGSEDHLIRVQGVPDYTLGESDDEELCSTESEGESESEIETESDSDEESDEEMSDED